MNLRQQKRAIVEGLLPACPFVTCKLQHRGVVVPPRFKDDETIAFRLGRTPNLIAIPDLQFTDEGWSGTLSFKPERYFCVVPWDACILVHTAAPFEMVVVQFQRVSEVEGDGPRATTPGLRLVKG